jgi:hypothetical protein
MKYNYVRRGFGVLICGSPIWLAVVSGVMSIGHNKSIGIMGIVFFILAGLITIANIHFSFLRPWLYYRKRKSMEKYQYESGIPMIGSILIILGIIVSFQNLLFAIIGLVTSVLDTGGLVWLLIMTWKDQSFWDEKGMKLF